MEGVRFNIEFLEERVLEEIRKLPKSIQILISKAMIERLQVDPLKHGKPLQNNYRGHRRLRISKYRIIYRIDLKNRKVIIVKVGIRKNIYN